MIRVGRSTSYLNESLSGELADVLKTMNKHQKNNIFSQMQSSGIDFSRSINGATKVTSNSDTRLKTDGNIIIGIYRDSNDNKYISVYQVGVGPLYDKPAYASKATEVKDKQGNIIKVKSFNKLSWKQWIDIMTSFYIIEKDKATSAADLIRTRQDNKPKEDYKNVSRRQFLSNVNKVGKLILDSKISSSELVKAIRENALYIKFYDNYRAIVKFEDDNYLKTTFTDLLDKWSDNTHKSSFESTYYSKSNSDDDVTKIYINHARAAAGALYIDYISREKVEQDRAAKEAKESEFSAKLTFSTLKSEFQKRNKYLKAKVTYSDDSFKIILNASNESRRSTNKQAESIMGELLRGVKCTKKKGTNTYAGEGNSREDTEGLILHYEGPDYKVEWITKTSRERFKDTGYILVTKN